MGCCGGSNPEEKKHNDDLDKQLKADRTKMNNEVKLLLLGAGESGKSTILKQMRLIHEQGYATKDKEAFKEIIFSNTLQSMRALCDAMTRLEIQYASPENAVRRCAVADVSLTCL